MDQSITLQLIVFILFFVLSAFFSSSETAYTAISKIKLRALVDQKVKRAPQLQQVLKNRKKLIIAILIGNNLANVVISALATAMILGLLSGIHFGNFSTNLAMVTVIMTTLILIFGEITPKTIAIKNPEKFALRFSPIFIIILWIFRPLIWIFTLFSNTISTLFGIDYTESKRMLTEAELKSALNLGREEGLIEEKENEMIHSIFEFSDTIVREIMTPRTDTICISVDKPISEAIHLISEKGHSRIPVYEDKIDNIIGVIYAKDLLGLTASSHELDLRKFIRNAIFIPETKNIEKLLQQMKKMRFHLAIAVDEYGGMAGIVTLEDIIEEIIGEIQDEYDTEEAPEFIQLSQDKYIVDAGTNINDFEKKFHIHFPSDEDYDSIGGLVLSLLGKFPAKGESITYHNIEFKVKNIRKRRIINFEITLQKVSKPSSTKPKKHI